MADAVLIADADGRIVFWNDAASRLFGWPAEEVLGQRLDVIIPERLRERHWTGWANVMVTGTTKYGDDLLEVPATHRDGRPMSIAFSVSLLTGPTGAVTGVAAVVRDDTERFQQRRAAREEISNLRAALEEAQSS
jgi:PAS domain S-box-containing protein